MPTIRGWKAINNHDGARRYRHGLVPLFRQERVEDPSVVGRQNDFDNRRLQNTVVAMITGNVSHAHEATQFLIDPSTPDGQTSGLRGPSAVRCSVLTTVAERTIIRRVGNLPAAPMRQINDCLKAALDLP
jgi:mRNA-degrading endonuclease toxin of MazEF toxin-antitoxin module